MQSIALDKRPDSIVPSGDDTDLAVEASRTLAAHRVSGHLRVKLEDGTDLVLPKAAGDLLAHILIEMARGNAVTLIPTHAQLSTQEAADILNVSRPFIVKLLESGKLRFSKVGTHRRINKADLDAYREQVAKDQEAAQLELARLAQEMGGGY